MRIFWKNYIYISVSLVILCAIFSIILPLQTHELPVSSLLSENKSRLFIYLMVILSVSAVISYISLKNIHKLLSITNSEIMELFRSNHNLNIVLPTDYSHKFTIENKFAHLKNAVNEARLTLLENIKKLQSENDQLLILINAINEGVAVISQKGFILTSNHHFEQIFEISSNPKGRPYWEVLRINEIAEIIESALQKKQSVFKEVSIIHPLEKYYFINIISPESSSDNIIAIFFDITEFKNLEKIKADLIANVSHELRTPLTAIKGYVETIEDEAYDTTEEKLRFLNIIKKHTDRLINIVSDLLVLSEIENKEFEYSAKDSKQSFESISLNSILNSCYESLKEKIKEKNLVFEKKVNDNIPETYGNAFLLEQAFINLIDNAIKYTPEGGKLGVSTTRDNNHVNVEIFDTGIGIPKESIPRIFERFYRVDKDRSRKEGGTGLGLSIVKHVVNLHNGDIKVESELSKGTKFTIKFPVKIVT